MAKVIRFIQLVLTNFAGLKNITVDYSTINALSGANGEGKTSIGTGPAWILWGKDLFGSDFTKDKYSPRPTNYQYDVVQASIIISVDGTAYKFAREIAGKKNNFYINDIPKTATEFSAAVESLFTQDEFMSLYFPSYFFSLHWTKQRELLLSNAQAPLTKTILAKLAEPQSQKLSELLKKHPLKDLEAKAKDDKPKLEKTLVAAESKVKTLQEQAEKVSGVSGTREELEQARLEHDEAIVQLEQSINTSQQANKAYQDAEHQYHVAHTAVENSKAKFPALKNETIDDTCRTCKQSLQVEAVKAVEADKARRIEEYKANHAKLVEDKKGALALFQSLELVDLQVYKSQQIAHQLKIKEINEQLSLLTIKESIEQDIEAAKQSEQEVRTNLRDTVFLLDAIKAYRAKEAEIQAEELQSKFKTLSVRLFKYIASRDEYEPDFSVQSNGKDYQYLSTGEKIGAGLELIEVLFEQTDMITPVFIDGIGEYTGKLTAYDQVITARAVEGQELTIKTSGGNE